ncbi:MerR family transcriptional regulator [Paraoerskovia marina]|uniref:MerR family transcriptional regulator n=1 Tax=Paraoerskovia marina TaxID=545619 RepID=UPI00069483C3|nr:MerR family transcriptional regulator [Paraoerskovia marina]
MITPQPPSGAHAAWSIQEVARLAGTTSRTLRHYDDVGLLPPSRVASNGHRYYDADALVRLQRILLLRDLGLGLPAVAEALAGEADEVRALRAHLGWLRAEQDRLARQIASVAHTIEEREGGGELVAEDMLDGFDHTQHKDEVEERWGRDAYARSNDWWTAKSDDERAAFTDESRRLMADWISLAEGGFDPSGGEAQAVAERHVAWLGSVPGTPGAGGEPVPEYVTGLGEMYVADPRFAKNYGGVEGATFVRDALAVWAQRRV